jgi:hypothetical protein
MKVKDCKTGVILETDNPFVIAQFTKYADRYKKIEKTSKTEKSKK